MNISAKGKALIKKYEGCRLTAYKAVPTEKYWTIGWGHYGADVKAGQKITQAQADAMFDKDIVRYVNPVNDLKMKLNQNQFDALVSFCYNCGSGALNTLCSDRNIKSIQKYLPMYNKSGGKVYQGLVRRRAEELALFNTPVKEEVTQVSKPVSKPKPKKAKRVTAKVDVRFYNKASWSDKHVAGICKKGLGFEIISTVTVDGAKQYKVKNSNGHIFYITAASKYVKVV